MTSGCYKTLFSGLSEKLKDKKEVLASKAEMQGQRTFIFNDVTCPECGSCVYTVAYNVCVKCTNIKKEKQRFEQLSTKRWA